MNPILTNKMNKMGIQIDLSSFFDDERKLVYVMVDPNWESVECLQKRVEYLFGVDSVRLLNSDGCFLPPKESIEIVKFCKGLKAFIPKESLERRKKKKAKKSKCVQKSLQESESEENLISIENGQEQKKRKYFSLDSVHTASIASNHAKRLKGSNATINEMLTTVLHENKCMEITSTSEQLQTLAVQPQPTVAATNSKKAKSKQSEHYEDVDVGNGHQSEVNNSVVEQNARISEGNMISCNKEINDQLTKSQTSTPKDTSGTVNNNLEISRERSSSIPSSTFLNESKVMVQKSSKRTANNSPNLNNPFKNQLLNKGHIYFNESGEVVSSTNKSQTEIVSKSDKASKTIVIFRCPLEEVINKEEPPKPRIFYIKRKNSINKEKKQVVEIREDIILTPIPNLCFENKNNSLVEKNVANELKNNEKTTEISAIDATKSNVALRIKTDLICTPNNTENTTITRYVDSATDKNLENSQIENNIKEVSLSQQAPISKLSATSMNQSSIMSVDCVDLSVDDSDKNANDSDIEEISEVIDLNETEDSRSLNNISIKNILPFCTSMLGMPNINDTIVFKMPYVDKKQQTGVTNFLAGKVEYINKRTKSIKVLIVDGHTEMCHIDPKLIINLNESQHFIQYLQIKMADIIEPKIYSRC